MIAYAVEATHCKALVTFIQRKINCEEHINVIFKFYSVQWPHKIYAVMCTFLQEFVCEMVFSF